MRKKIIIKMIALGLILQFFSVPLFSKIAPPQPPAENPHSPVTQIDKARVAFAEQSIQLFLMKKLDVKADAKNKSDYQNKNLACLKNVKCYGKDKAFLSNLETVQKMGLISEIRHAHLIPWALEQYQKNLNGVSLQQGSEKDIELPPGHQEHHAEEFAPVAMPIPKLKKDEYMVHVYAQIGYAWYHVDVVMSENKKGELFLRYFFATPMPFAKLPPGVVC